ncbi:hypothetical protein G6F57_004860 [Rhizopus arrhizus]|uniref:Rab-GAP TBC domain-containing protein n=1 Tax=Rhizopus oryzae TaxID=64495 RepID=A0A9P6WZQ0_RHIOR|nr:hypothetical protein G6F23_008432 [Rhizopus arrhizus]KAG1402465.1 hypothetical protein G6F58_010547 [Rhizopus delemar]KAG0756178.1 hypothetical protein G6F24_011331 [Rhizopus arrhizus]KAG0788764.1 hypothetical protein G6F22_006907 [Rhizopus arrhizus]KAG0792024.1 hypothetical protein G6F21_004660 [Rhizopus arrhizus]
MESSFKERLKYFRSVLNEQDDSSEYESIIDIKTFRNACFYGIPDEPGLRSTAWKVLLGYLPPDKRMWTNTLKNQRLCYNNWVVDLLQDPAEEPLSVDHPLNDERGSKWASYFEDNLVLEQIDKDVRRTLPDFAFFQLPINSQQQEQQKNDYITDPLSVSIPEEYDLKTVSRFSFTLKSSINSKSTTESEVTSRPRNIVRKLSNAFISSAHLKLPNKRHSNSTITNRRSLSKRISCSDSQKLPDDDDDAYHWQVIQRILFIYAKLNPGVGYVQGMNELLAPIYYVFAAADSDDGAEADAFFVFTILMSNFRDHFVRSLDSDTSTGIHATMKRLGQRLAWFDQALFQDLSQKDVKEQYYAFRWITVLYSQEWNLPDVIRLWDSILAEEGQFEFLLDFAVAMLVCVRRELMLGDFADNMRILQNYPIDDIQIVLKSAYAIRKARLLAKSSQDITPNEFNDSNIEADLSDTSSISSSNDSHKLRKDIHTSFDSISRGRSKEFSDELFRKNLLSINDDIDINIKKNRMSTGGMITQSLSQKLGIVNTQMRRTTSVHLSNDKGFDEGEIQKPKSIFGRFSLLASSSPIYQELQEKTLQTKADYSADIDDTTRVYKGFI